MEITIIVERKDGEKQPKALTASGGVRALDMRRGPGGFPLWRLPAYLEAADRGTSMQPVVVGC